MNGLPGERIRRLAREEAQRRSPRGEAVGKVIARTSMYEKLTQRMGRVIKASQRIARDYGQDYVGTEHLLLAILDEGTGRAVEILHALGADLPKIKGVVDRLIKNSLEDTWVFGRLPGSPHFRNVMAAAIEEARQLESKVVNAEHLLLALAREEGSVAHTALSELDVKVGTIRSEIVKRLHEPYDDPEAC